MKRLVRFLVTMAGIWAAIALVWLVAVYASGEVFIGTMLFLLTAIASWDISKPNAGIERPMKPQKDV